MCDSNQCHCGIAQPGICFVASVCDLLTERIVKCCLVPVAMAGSASKSGPQWAGIGVRFLLPCQLSKRRVLDPCVVNLSQQWDMFGESC